MVNGGKREGDVIVETNGNEYPRLKRGRKYNNILASGHVKRITCTYTVQYCNKK